jgi:hypothetical protein
MSRRFQLEFRATLGHPIVAPCASECHELPTPALTKVRADISGARRCFSLRRGPAHRSSWPVPPWSQTELGTERMIAWVMGPRRAAGVSPPVLVFPSGNASGADFDRPVWAPVNCDRKSLFHNKGVKQRGLEQEVTEATEKNQPPNLFDLSALLFKNFPSRCQRTSSRPSPAQGLTSFQAKSSPAWDREKTDSKLSAWERAGLLWLSGADSGRDVCLGPLGLRKKTI